jgi:hypothetical protein
VGRTGEAGSVRLPPWMILGLVALLTVGAGALGASQATRRAGPTAGVRRSGPVPSASTTTLQPAPSGRPEVDGPAWAGHGDLAFVSRGHLEILSNDGRLVRVSGPPDTGSDESPAWSVDGHWLAFLHTGPAVGYSVPAPTLWLVAAGSSVAKEIGNRSVGMFAWSPTAAVLAYTAAEGAPAVGPEAIFLVRPDGVPVPIPVGTGDGVGRIAWSPNGLELAFDDVSRQAVSPFGMSRVGSVAIAGGRVVTDYQMSGGGLTLAGWWPDGGGLLFWEDPQFSASIAADGLVLYSLPAGSSEPVPLATTLVGPFWWTSGPNDTIAIVSGGGRAIWQAGRDVERCPLRTGGCRSAPLPSGTVGLAPSWSDTGGLFYSVAPAPYPPGELSMGGPGFQARWDADNTLWLWPAQGSPRRLTSAPAGVVSSAAAVRGPDLLAVSGDALWLVDPNGHQRPALVARPLFSTPDPRGYYGEVDWEGTFAWSAAAGPLSGQVAGDAELGGPNPELP